MSSPPEKRPTHALRYVAGFRCIAERCEDTCCTGMQIVFGEENRRALEGWLRERGADDAEVSACLTKLPEPVHGLEWALGKDERGACRFLEPDLLCSLIGRHGEAVIPDACALFPRVAWRSAEGLEVAASLACPEAARGCLLGEGSTDVLAVSDDFLSRLPAVTLPESPEAYAGLHRELREVGLAVLTRSDASVGERLMRLAALGAAVAKGDEGQLRSELERARGGGGWEEARAALVHEEAPAEPVIQALLAVATGLQRRGSARFNALTGAVLHTFQCAALELSPDVGQPDGPPLWRVFSEVLAKKHRRAEAVLGAWLALPLRRFWVNDWHREPFVRSGSFLAHAFRMALRGALLRFLLLGHPALDAAAAGEPLAAGARAPALEEALVETVQIFAKHIERDGGLVEMLDEHLAPDALGVSPLDRCRMFSAWA